MNFTHTHKLAAGAALAIIVSLLSFTGYAYATGTNPVSLVKRWIEGDKVKIEYQNRHFEQSVHSRTYSDAAVSAYAELHTVEGLNFRAAHAYGQPKDGIEYVDDIFHHGYTYPWVGAIERMDDTNIYVRKQFILGDKMLPSAEVSDLQTIPRQTFILFVNGEPSDLSDAAIGKLVRVDETHYLAYRTGSHETPTPVTKVFGFALIQDLPSIKEAWGNGKDDGSQNASAIYEPGWGGTSNQCMNNAADSCDPSLTDPGKNQGLYGQKNINGSYTKLSANPAAIPIGEAAADGQPANLLLRGVDGVITEVTTDHLTIRSSSGSVWTLDFTRAQQDAFAKMWGKPLSAGDKIGGDIIEFINNLDNRHVDNAHVYSLMRH